MKDDDIKNLIHIIKKEFQQENFTLNQRIIGLEQKNHHLEEQKNIYKWCYTKLFSTFRQKDR